MQRLYVLYDDGCGLCLWARQWAGRQPALVELCFIAADSDAARRLFPSLPVTNPPDELVAVSDTGEVYRGGSAWVMVLYALRDYREWSLRLGSPVLLPLARQGFSWLSKNRRRISYWLFAEDDDLAGAIREVPAPACGLVRGTETGRPGTPNPGRERQTGPTGWKREFNL